MRTLSLPLLCRFAAARVVAPAAGVALLTAGGVADGISAVSLTGAALFGGVWALMKAANRRPSSA